MGRFGLHGSSLREPQDDDDEVQQALGEDEEEPPHPVPFSPNWGRTRFSLHPPKENYLQLQQRFFGPSCKTVISGIFELESRQQHFPPVNKYWDASTASAGAMLEYGQERRQPREEEDYDIEDLIQLFGASNRTGALAKHVQVQNQVGQKLKAVSDAVAREQQKLEQWLEASQKRMEKESAISQNRLKGEIKANYEVAKAYIKQEKQQKKDMEDLVKQQEEVLRLEREAQEEATRKDQSKRDEIKRTAQAKKDKQEQARAEVERQKSAKTAYVSEAKDLVAKLVKTRAVIQPFDKNKAVSKRRMNMKKMCRGKVNTLAAEVGKVQSVAAELIAALKSEKEVDEQVQGKLEEGAPELTPDMAKGETYFLDLLASSALVRIQAEGFNGPRGDGFPLAAFLAMVSFEIKDFAPIFEAHIYSVCPTAIPALPKPSSSASEDDLMESLGMAKNKNGEFESFERFLQRTEGIISIVANIMASHPEGHTLFGGHKSAITWLQRFISLLPTQPEQLPLNTAPVLDAFLTGAGHMLANLCPDEFKKILDLVVNDLVTRLDVGSIGAPRAHRLKETVKDGFEGFKNKLPSKSLEQLYNDGGSGPPPMPVAPIQPPPGSAPNPFGMPSSSNSNPFGQTPINTNANPFGGQVNSSPFAAAPGGSNQMSNDSGMDFGGQPVPFGAAGAAPANPFGVPNTSGGAPFGNAAQNPFGGGDTAFGGTSQPQQTAQFGSSPFGGSNPRSAAFGANSQQQSVVPFGAPQLQQTSSPFGGGGQQQHNPPPFGSGGHQQNQSPFGGGGQQQQNPPPFGNQSHDSEFGANYPSGPSNSGRNKKNSPPCRFFAQGTCRYGDKCKFSHDTPSGGGNSGFSGPRR